MDTDSGSGVCARDKEIRQIRGFISAKVDAKQSGILYVTGPPGTGKTMSVRYVLDQLKHVSVFSMNCMRAQSPKQILSKLCSSLGLQQFVKCNENEMISRLTRQFSGRASKPHIIVLDEIDQAPKSSHTDFIRTIFSWPEQPHSRLILIGIANIVNLTSRCMAASLISGKDSNHITRIVFRPYSSKDIKDILLWYLENDENFEDARMEPKALELISKKVAHENGDIRSALNALKSALDDTLEKKVETKACNDSLYPTPPATPPMTPCKERTTNIASVANSVKKRQRNYDFGDLFPFPYQVTLVCIQKLSQRSSSAGVEIQTCKNLVLSALTKISINPSSDEFRGILDNLETQGLINFKKTRHDTKIYLKASESEQNQFITRRDIINDLLKGLV